MTQLLSRKEAAAALRVGLSTLQLYVARGFLAPIHRGRNVFFLAESVDKLSGRDLPPVWPAKQRAADGHVRTVAVLDGEPRPKRGRPARIRPARPLRDSLSVGPTPADVGELSAVHG